MGLFATISEVFAGSSSATTTDDSAGAYWCHDCEERIRDANVAGEEPPTVRPAEMPWSSSGRWDRPAVPASE